MPCGDLENRRYIQTRFETIYMCGDPDLPSPFSTQKVVLQVVIVHVMHGTQ
jgi:hypothetical protein